MKKFETLELDVNSIKPGDCILMRYDYMPNAAAIRYFTNLNKPENLRCPFNHVLLGVDVIGYPYMAEAKGSGTSKLEAATTRLDGKKIAILRPKFHFPIESFNKIAIEYSAKGIKYDFKGTFWEQFIFQTTGFKRNKSEEEGDEKLYCSEYYARVINRMFPDMYNGENGEIPYYMVDPQDLYVDERYEIIFEGKAKIKC